MNRQKRKRQKELVEASKIGKQEIEFKAAWGEIILFISSVTHEHLKEHALKTGQRCYVVLDKMPYVKLGGVDPYDLVKFLNEEKHLDLPAKLRYCLPDEYLSGKYNYYKAPKGTIEFYW